MTAITAQTSDLYVYDVYSIMHMADVLCLFYVYLCKCHFTKSVGLEGLCTWTHVYIAQLSVYWQKPLCTLLIALMKIKGTTPRLGLFLKFHFSNKDKA